MFRSARKAARRGVSNGGQNSVYDYYYQMMGKADGNLVSGVEWTWTGGGVDGPGVIRTTEFEPVVHLWSKEFESAAK